MTRPTRGRVEPPRAVPPPVAPPPGVTVEVDRYEVTAYPYHDENRDTWTIRVVRRPGPEGRDRWAVLLGSSCWNRRTRTWDYEMQPSSRTAAFRRTHRFPLEEALAIAVKQAPLITRMGMTAADAAAQTDAWRTEEEAVRA